MWRKSSPHLVFVCKPFLCFDIDKKRERIDFISVLTNQTEENNLDKITSFKNPSRNNDYLTDFDDSYSFVALTHLIMSWMTYSGTLAGISYSLGRLNSPSPSVKK